jgi:hypothetical protein
MEGVDCDYPFEREMSNINDCVPCSEQADVETETNEFDQVIIEWCCGNKSMLGQPSKHSSSCKVVRLTIDDDLRTIEGFEKTLEIVKQRPRGETLLWSPMPRAGGTPLQYINRARGVGLEKLEAHLRDFYVLWDHFEIVVEEVMSIGGIVVNEWPEKNDYRQQPKVIQMLDDSDFFDSIFHGCACGLVSKYGPCPGTPIKKSWRGSSNNPIAWMYLEDKCANRNKVLQREHGDNRGGECEETENYTAAIIDAIHKGFLMCCEKITLPPHVNDTGSSSSDTKRIVFNPCNEATPSPEITPFSSRFASRTTTPDRSCNHVVADHAGRG